MERRFNLNHFNLTTSQNNEPKKTSRRCFLKKTAVFTGLVLSPLKFTKKALAADLQMDYLINNMSTADMATTILYSSSSPFCTSATTYFCSSACETVFKTDLNKDGTVNSADLRIMTRDWLSSDTSARLNIDSSHTWVPNSAGSIVAVDNRDLAQFKKGWLQSYCNSATSTVF